MASACSLQPGRKYKIRDSAGVDLFGHIQDGHFHQDPIGPFAGWLDGNVLYYNAVQPDGSFAEDGVAFGTIDGLTLTRFIGSEQYQLVDLGPADAQT